MARELGLAYCRGILPTGHYCPRSHRLNGEAAGGTIHFADRQVTKTNTLAFLKLAAMIVDPALADEPVPWRRVYLLNRLVRELGARLRLRIPTRLTKADKAFVLASIAGLSNEVPMRKQAFDWARR